MFPAPYWKIILSLNWRLYFGKTIAKPHIFAATQLNHKKSSFDFLREQSNQVSAAIYTILFKKNAKFSVFRLPNGTVWLRAACKKISECVVCHITTAFIVWYLVNILFGKKYLIILVILPIRYRGNCYFYAAKIGRFTS